MNKNTRKVLELLQHVRDNILTLIAGLTETQMNHIPARMNNNLVWNLGHLILTQQMLCYKLGGIEPVIDMEYFARFAPGTVPDSNFNNEEIQKIKIIFSSAFEQLAADLEADIFEKYQMWTLPSNIVVNGIEDAMVTNAMHASRHFGVILSLCKLLP